MTTRREDATAPLKLAGILAGVLGGLTLTVIADTPLLDLDRHIAGLVVLAPESPAWIAALRVTELGGSTTVLPVMVAVSLMLIRAGETRLLPGQWGGFIACRVITTGLKHGIGRERMDMTETTELLAGAASPSFPSGHATAAMFVYGFLGYLMLTARLPAGVRRGLAILLGILIITVAASRMLLGVHYLSDVIGGFLSGGIGLAIAAAAARKAHGRRA